MPTFLSLLSGIAFAFLTLAAPLAGAEEPRRIAQAEAGASDAVAPELDPDTTGAETGVDVDLQEAPADVGIPPGPDVETIVILGTTTVGSEDLQTTDSVTGFDSADLEALGVKDVSDLAAFTPNLEIVTSGATTPTFFIRGVGLNDFNANSTGSVALYRDDVVVNAPALQLGTLFDVETVNVLRGPQGTGLARNASAGAIRIYSRKPSGDFGGYLRSELGNYNFRDFEGALEAPLWEDMLAGRLAFRLSKRDGTMENRCGDAPAFQDRVEVPPARVLAQLGKTSTDPPWSICGEPVLRTGAAPFISDIPVGLESDVNNLNNWGARGTLLFEPTLDMKWLLGGHGSRRDELTRLGQSYGTQGFFCENGDVANCFPGSRLAPDNGTRILGVLGGPQGIGAGYQPPEVKARLRELAPCIDARTCNQLANRQELNDAKVQLANELAQDPLDSEPWAGDFNRTGSTTNDTWGAYLKGELWLPAEIQLTSVTGYDGYDRLIDIDLDFSPETLFHIVTDDDGWQVVQDLRLEGELGKANPLRWDVGGWFLRESLNVTVNNDLGRNSLFGVGERDYTQDVYSAAGYASVAFDFWDDYTLDGGFRYNWERKTLDYLLITGSGLSNAEHLDTSWDAPTGTVRLTYRFLGDDASVYWKYTRGWKPGTFNATGSLATGVSTADPEIIDAFELGGRGNWFDGRLGIDLSLFYYSYQNYQIFTAQQFAGGNPEFVILNAKDAEVYGAELDAVARPWEGGFANVRFGWLESQFLDFVQLQQEIIAPQGVQVVVNRELQNSGNQLLNSPRFKVSLTGEQTFYLGRYGSVTARYDGVWTDTTFFDATEGRGIPNAQNIQFLPEETIAQPAFWLHNLRVSYLLPGERIEIAGWVRNLTNQAYKTFAFDGSTFNNTTIYFVGDPRTFGGSLIVNF